MLHVKQDTRNPDPEDRLILTLLASGYERPEVARMIEMPERAMNRRLDRLRAEFAPTLLSLMALAVKLEWIAVRITIPK